MKNPQSLKIATLLALIFLTPKLSAQSTFTWNGGGTDGNWTTGGNWGGTAPASPQAFLNFNGATRTTNTNNFSAGGAGFQIYFKSGANAFQLYGNGINFFDFSSLDPNIQNEGAFTNQTINFPITNANTHVQGTIRILNINSNTTTAQGPLTFNGPISTPSDGNARALNVWGTNTVTFNGAISDGGSGSAMGVSLLGTGTTVLTASNTYVGQTTVSGGTLSLSGGSIAAGSFVKVNTGGALSVTSTGKIFGGLQISTNTTAAQNASISGTVAGNVQIDPGNTNVTPSASGLYTSPASGFVQLNLSASVASGGFITNQGVLNLTGSSALTLGTIIGPGSDAAGNLGGILDNNTNSKTLTLGNGSAFAYYKPAGGIPGTTLQIVGNGSAFIKWFGYNAVSGIAYTNILNGGTWTFANVGQNNSGQQFAGTLIVTNSATVNVTNNINAVHGTWNIISNSSVTFNQSGKSLQPLNAAGNIGLNIGVSNNGSLFVGGNGVTLGFATGTGVANTAAENSSLTVGAGGTVVVTNTFNVGAGAANGAAETNFINLSGGKLLVTGTLTAGSANNVITNASPYNPVAPVNVFNWTGGQLSAATITTSNGLVIIGVTNSVPTTFFVTNPAVFNAGNLNSTTLTNNAGTLAPGDTGVAGKTTINGSYVQTSGGTLDIDLNGTTAASGFQTASAYDLLAVTNTASLAGNLIVRTNGAATISGTTGFTILTTAANGLSGTFNNLYNNRVGISGGNGASFAVVFNTASVVLTNYAALSASFTPVSGSSPAPFTQTFNAGASVGAITNYNWTFTDNATMTNVVNTSSATTSFTFTNAGNYSVQLIVTATDGTKATNSSAGGAFTATGNPTLAWTGSASANWNTTDQNWTNLTADGLTTTYIDADPVIFNEQGSAHPTVNLPATVQPASVNFSNSATTYTLQGAGKISGSTVLNKSLAGTTIILTTNDFTGGTTISGGALQLGDGATANGTLGNGNITNNASLVLNPAGAQTLANVISGSGNVSVRNATVTLSAANSFSGGTTVSNAATLGISADNNLGLGGVTLNNGTLTTSGSFTLSNRTVTLGAGNGTISPAATLTVTNPITGGGALNVSGAGTLVLSANNSFTGATTIGSGVLQIGSGAASGSVTTNILLSGGSLAFSRTDNFLPAGNIAASSSASSITNSSTAAGNTNALALADGINSLGTIRNASAGTLALNASANSTNNLAGSFVNSPGALAFNGGSWFVTNNFNPAGSSVSLNGATVVASGGMASYGTTNLLLNSGTLFVSGGARLSTVLSNANFAMSGGSVLVSNTSFGIRLGNSSGNNAAQGGYVQFTGTQTGGSIVVASNISDNTFSLGGFGPIASAQSVSYTLSGGSLTVPQGAGSASGIFIGADSNLLGTTTFTLAGTGKALVNLLKGAQSAASGAKQFFNFSGGTLAAFNVDVSNLQSSNAPGIFGTLYNNGGTLSPGDSGTAGKTAITGNFTNSAGSVLAVDLGGTTAATTFQSANTNYDFISVSGSTLLGGSLNVSLIGGYTPAATDSLVILTNGGTLSGNFSNLLASNRVSVIGNSSYSFLVITSATQVVLTNYALTLPGVTVSPASTNITYGTTVGFTANTSGAGPDTYQWYDNSGAAISGATSSTLSLTPAVAASGTYSVIVANGNGYATNTFTVTVTKATPAVTLAVNNSPAAYNGSPQSAAVIIVSSSTAGGVTNIVTGGAATQTATGTYAVTADFVPSDTANYNSVTGIAVGNFAIAPSAPAFAVSSTKNPDGYNDAVSFTATLPSDATGSIVFSTVGGAFNTNSLSAGSASSSSLSNLLRGTNVITFAYLGDGNYFGVTNTLNQIVTNHPPTTSAVSYQRNAAVNSFKIAVTNLLTNTSDADGDTVTVASVSSTTNNAVIQLRGDYVLYYNTNAVADQFTYTVSDGFGGTNSATVSLAIDSTPLFGQSQIVSVSGGAASLNFAGIPSYNYSVQRSTNLTSWISIWTTNAPAGGMFKFDDYSAPSPSAYYRLQYNP
jgi:fibronectin-binding autotransporter adhesin